MGIPTNLQNVDERGYTFVTDAADCQIGSRAKSIGTTVTPFPQDATGASANLPGRRFIFVKNNNSSGGSTLFIGGADVTSTNGYPIAPQEEVVLDITDDIQLFGVTSTLTADARTLELA